MAEYGRHLGFYQKIEIVKKRRKLRIFDLRLVKYGIIKQFAAFCVQFVFFHLKKNGVTTCYL